MGTLLLRLAGPLQAWGISSKFETRRTEPRPTKSGVIGLLAAALGRRRDEPVEDLNALRFGVRVDQPGSLLRDFHTAHSEKTAYITDRYYLADAVFLVGLESGDEVFLRQLESALRAPKFPLFLGRRSCPPTQPFVLGIRPLPLLDALGKEPWLAAEFRRPRLDAHLELSSDAAPEDRGAAMQQDQPLSFDPHCRRHGYRLEAPRGMVDKTPAGEGSHDPMSELR